jgi:predicted RNA binding protein YcfA (HicA-like mRNA interferase family)
MATNVKLIQKILQGQADANINFEELCSLLKSFGFEERISGSHHIFRRNTVEERLNLQRDGAKAKPYQVRQVRALILKYRLGSEGDA